VREGRPGVLVDNNPEAMAVMAKRPAFARPRWHGIKPPVVGEARGKTTQGSRTDTEPVSDLFAREGQSA
jgi:hypothetical protein